MCGICGSFAVRDGLAIDAAHVRTMMAALAHRGPDDAGVFDDDPRAVLGFRRLAILDLSPAGNQPQQVDHVVSVLNGEIYNYRELRAELEARGHPFRSTGDAEVLPHLYLEYGERCVERLHGMFALALFDRRRGVLLLARDRLGKKPLYYRAADGRIDFASEAKALLPAGGAVVPDACALAGFLTFGVVPGERSAFAGLRRLPPGHRLIASAQEVRSEPYWQPPRADAPLAGTVDEWQERVFAALCAAVAKRLQSDVPLGLFLSGGIDSGLILAAAAAVTDAPMHTFTIGFDDPRFDERELAAATARHFGVTAEVMVATPVPAHALAEIAAVYDEPFGDPSAYPTLLVSRLARERVTVALSGDGGDEAFAGYRRHRALALADAVGRLLPRAAWRLLTRLVGEAANGAGGRGTFGELRRFATALGLPAAERNLYWSTWFRGPLRRRFFHPELLEAAGLVDEAEHESLRWFADAAGTTLQRALAVDLRRYLVDDLLVKTDLASMACGLEVRAPFLDHQLIELAARVPGELLQRGGETKFLLRELARRHLPAPVAAARKRGFGVPLAAWLRGPLRGLAEDWLLGERFAGRRLIRPGGARELLARHLSGREDWSAYLWLLLVAEAWHRRYVDRDAALGGPTA